MTCGVSAVVIGKPADVLAAPTRWWSWSSPQLVHEPHAGNALLGTTVGNKKNRTAKPGPGMTQSFTLGASLVTMFCMVSVVHEDQGGGGLDGS